MMEWYEPQIQQALARGIAGLDYPIVLKDALRGYR